MAKRVLKKNPNIIDIDETHRIERIEGVGLTPDWVAFARKDAESRWEVAGKHADRDEAQKIALAHKIKE